jgi:FPC/CPF motif-containing protein YcgG
MASDAALTSPRGGGGDPTVGRPTILVIGGKPKTVKNARELRPGVVYGQYPKSYQREHWEYVDQAVARPHETDPGGDDTMTTRGSKPEKIGAALGVKLLSDTFSCVAGKTAWLRGSIVHRHFGPMGKPATTDELSGAVTDFALRRNDIDELLATFVATFEGPFGLDETDFETLVWEQLQGLHDRDVCRFAWADFADPDPASDRFAFSIAGQAFFVVGMHANSSRITRQFSHPTLVFNSHVQFERLRERGIYGRIRDAVRVREMALQGSINPNLSDFGERSEAVQYSGRATSPDWICPFRPRTDGLDREDAR